MDKFTLKLPYPDDYSNKQPVIRLKPTYYQTLSVLKARTGLPLGNIVEQCIDYALEHMEDSMMMPHVGLAWTVVLSFCVGLMLSSAFPAILLYAQELLPNKLGLISGLFFGFAFGIAGIASAILGGMADKYGIEAVYNVCAFMPLLGLVACFLPNLKKR